MDTKAVGRRIQTAREECYMAQRNLAEAVGCTSQHISAIERGVKVPTMETFVAIAATLRVPTDVLLQDVLPDWWNNWSQEIDRVLAPLLPHMRAYVKQQIMEHHQQAEIYAQMGKGLSRK